jgi:hypothetical protein
MQPKLYHVCAAITGATALVHPGLLHTNEDFDRISDFVERGVEPQLTGWKKLEAAADPNKVGAAEEIVCRGASWCSPSNFGVLINEARVAYLNAVYWRVTGDETYGDSAASILDAWSSTLKEVTGSNDKYLVSGLQGYQLANAAEVLRDYEGWTGLQATIDMLQRVFLPMNAWFVETHNNYPVDHYWANVRSHPSLDDKCFPSQNV